MADVNADRGLNEDDDADPGDRRDFGDTAD
jgi:hypothetical protein